MLDDRDELHDRALAWSRAVREPVLTSEYVLVETSNYLSQRIDPPRFHRLFDGLLRLPTLQCVWGGRHLFDAGVELQLRHEDKAWSLTDCISFHLMREMGMTAALAHDHHFEQAGFEALLRRDPP